MARLRRTMAGGARAHSTMRVPLLAALLPPIMFIAIFTSRAAYLVNTVSPIVCVTTLVIIAELLTDLSRKQQNGPQAIPVILGNVRNCVTAPYL